MTEKQAVEFLEFYKDTIPKEPPIEAIIDKDKHWYHDNEELLEVIDFAIKAIEENERLKVSNAELKKTIEYWNEVSYEQHEAIKKTRNKMQSLDKELCSHWLIEDFDKEAHIAYNECLDILDEYIHNMYVKE